MRKIIPSLILAALLCACANEPPQPETPSSAAEISSAPAPGAPSVPPNPNGELPDVPAQTTQEEISTPSTSQTFTSGVIFNLVDLNGNPVAGRHLAYPDIPVDGPFQPGTNNSFTDPSDANGHIYINTAQAGEITVYTLNGYGEEITVDYPGQGVVEQTVVWPISSGIKLTLTYPDGTPADDQVTYAYTGKSGSLSDAQGVVYLPLKQATTVTFTPHNGEAFVVEYPGQGIVEQTIEVQRIINGIIFRLVDAQGNPIHGHNLVYNVMGNDERATAPSDVNGYIYWEADCTGAITFRTDPGDQDVLTVNYPGQGIIEQTVVWPSPAA